MPDAETRIRIDKWLWAARFYKTRSLATEAVQGGKVELNGDRAKPAKTVGPGDEIRVRLGPYEHVVIVRAVAPRRGSARDAQALYDETPESRTAQGEARRPTPHGTGSIRMGRQGSAHEEGPAATHPLPRPQTAVALAG